MKTQEQEGSFVNDEAEVPGIITWLRAVLFYSCSQENHVYKRLAIGDVLFQMCRCVDISVSLL